MNYENKVKFSIWRMIFKNTFSVVALSNACFRDFQSLQKGGVQDTWRRCPRSSEHPVICVAQEMQVLTFSKGATSFSLLLPFLSFISFFPFVWSLSVSASFFLLFLFFFIPPSPIVVFFS